MLELYMNDYYLLQTNPVQIYLTLIHTLMTWLMIEDQNKLPCHSHLLLV